MATTEWKTNVEPVWGWGPVTAQAAHPGAASLQGRVVVTISSSDAGGTELKS